MWPLLLILLQLAIFFDNYSVVVAAVETLQVESIQYDASTCRTSSLYPSTWPNDHGDSSRTKFTVNAGLPSTFEINDLKVTEQPDPIPKAMWLYTYGENSEFVIYMGGTLVNAYVAKADAKTLRIIQKIDFPTNMYMGGLLMHRNGHVYAVHGNVLYRFWYGDLYNSTERTIPTQLNGRMVQTNGMVVTNDGLLVVRQWNYYLEDTLLILSSAPFLWRVITAFLLVSATAGAFCLPTRHRENKLKGVLWTMLAAAAGAFVGVAILLIGLIAILQRNIGRFDPIPFLISSILVDNKGGGSEIKLIHPDTFDVKHNLFISERCSGGRTALSHLASAGVDAIVVVGDEFIHQLRWNAVQNSFYEMEDWAERYRTRHTGTFPGTGPAIHKGVVYFTDNTFPVGLYGQSYSMFRKPLELSSESTGTLTRIPLTPAETPGFMFWSVVVSPRYDDILVWDTAGQSVQMRRASDMSLKWNISSIQGDCIAIAADRDHVYLTDYNDGTTFPDGFPRNIVQSKQLYPRLQKFFLVVNASTGDVIANITLERNATYSSSIIVPGAHNDVYIGSTSGLLRIHI